MLSQNAGIAVDEEGRIVSLHVCNVCGDEFTICPPWTSENPCFVRHAGDWGGCGQRSCETYDQARDMDGMFDADEGEEWKT